MRSFYASFESVERFQIQRERGTEKCVNNDGKCEDAEISEIFIVHALNCCYSLLYCFSFLYLQIEKINRGDREAPNTAHRVKQAEDKQSFMVCCCLDSSTLDCCSFCCRCCCGCCSCCFSAPMKHENFVDFFCKKREKERFSRFREHIFYAEPRQLA